MVATCKERDVVVNMGTLRRYDPGYDAAHKLIHSGELGKLKTIIAHSTANLFNGSSHTFGEPDYLFVSSLFRNVSGRRRRLGVATS